MRGSGDGWCQDGFAFGCSLIRVLRSSHLFYVSESFISFDDFETLPMRTWRLWRETRGYGANSLINRTRPVLHTQWYPPSKEVRNRDSSEDGCAQPSIFGVAQFGKLFCSSERLVSSLRLCAIVLAKLND